MGTRGTTGFIIDGTTTASYQQFDSYPEGVGIDVLAFARTLADPLARAEAEQRARALVPVDESGKPSTDQALALAKYTDGRVSTGSDWYATLRSCQGLPALILESGYILNTIANLHAEEYDWQIDFDANVLRGFAGEALIAEYSIDALPTKEEFLAHCAAETEAAFAD